MSAHIHAALMKEYAKDALETDKPWERWEYKYDIDKWMTCSVNPVWDSGKQYRRKPTARTKTVYQWANLFESGYWIGSEYFHETEADFRASNALDDSVPVKRLDYTALEVPA